jgi:chloramphenicol 3-O phosphotransferase
VDGRAGRDLPGAARVILDDVFVGGVVGQRRLREATGDIDVLWVGVRCDAAVAEGRELARGHQVGVLAAAQALVVHEGVEYDVEVDTTHTESVDCARTIVRAWQSA